MENLINFFADNWGYITPLVLWLVARLIKTERNYDLVEMILKFIGDYIIPNRRVNNSHRGGYPGSVNRWMGNTGKFPFIILMLLIPSLTFGQLNGNFKSVRFVNAGSNEASIPTIAGNGAIYYNEGTQTFRAFQNGVWQDLIGAGGIVSASNGLTVVGDDVRLGGTITLNNTSLDVSLPNADIYPVSSNSLISGIHYKTPPVIVLPASTALKSNNVGFYIDEGNLFSAETGAVSGGIYILDNRTGGNATGLEYIADYSTNFTDRSIVDQGFVNSRLGSFLTGSLTGAVAVIGNSNVFALLNLGATQISSTSTIALSSTGAGLNFTSPNSSIAVNDLTVQVSAPMNITGLYDEDGYRVSDLNASLFVEPSGFDINLTSEFGDMNINGDAINATTLSTTAAAPSEPITLTTGQNTSTGNTGAINLNSGQANTGSSGDINITTGLSVGNTGGIALTTGNATGNSGIIQLATGTAGGTVGGIEFEFGGTANRIDFDPTVTQFNTLGNYSLENPSGSLTIEPATTLDLITEDDPGAGTTGPITIASGTSVSGNTGNIIIQTGTTSATQGSITLGTIILLAPSLPTSSVGLPSGAIWNNAGVLNIIP